jgi:hypothetical protein
MRSLLALALLSSLAAVAVADPKPTQPAQPTGAPMSTDDCAKARRANRPCKLDITAEDVRGNKPVGDGLGVTAVDWQKLGSLLRIRHDFIDQIVKSADDLP